MPIARYFRQQLLDDLGNRSHPVDTAGALSRAIDILPRLMLAVNIGKVDFGFRRKLRLIQAGGCHALLQPIAEYPR